MGGLLDKIQVRDLCMGLMFKSRVATYHVVGVHWYLRRTQKGSLFAPSLLGGTSARVDPDERPLRGTREAR